MTKFVVGLTGGIGCGKTTVANMFGALGVQLIDADIIAREVVEPDTLALTKIKAHFGDEVILLPEGDLNRAKLRQIVFSCDKNKQWLNQLLHPLIRQSILDKIELSTSIYCILVAPLLLENKLTHLVNRVLVIDLDEKTQLERTLVRDSSLKANPDIDSPNMHNHNIDKQSLDSKSIDNSFIDKKLAAEKQTIEKIIASQLSRKERVKQADDVIDNNANSDLTTLKKQVEQLHATYLNKANLLLSNKNQSA